MFKYDLGSTVSLKFSEEFGEVIGRAQYLHGEDNYLVRYKAGDDRQVDSWWGGISYCIGLLLNKHARSHG